MRTDNQGGRVYVAHLDKGRRVGPALGEVPQQYIPPDVVSIDSLLDQFLGRGLSSSVNPRHERVGLYLKFGFGSYSTLY